jgi:hypothetical protein
MSIRLDPRHLGTLRALASEAGVRPGELVILWVTERLDAERRGAPSPLDVGPVLESLNDRIEALTRRVDGLASRDATPATTAPTSTTTATADAVMAQPPPAKRRGRPPKSASSPAVARKAKRSRGKNPAVPLHEEIAAVLAERGPLSAGELAAAVTARGIYAPPRSGKPLDATAVSVRVSNPRYRSRFTRGEGKIGLAG